MVMMGRDKLWRAEAQAELGDYSGCIETLNRGWSATESPVLKVALCDSLIAACVKDTNAVFASHR